MNNEEELKKVIAFHKRQMEALSQLIRGSKPDNEDLYLGQAGYDDTEDGLPVAYPDEDLV